MSRSLLPISITPRLLALVLSLAAAGAGAQTAIPIGGALKFDNDAVWKRIVEEAGGPGVRFAVFATAAGNPQRSAGQIIEALSRQGAVAEHIPVAPRLKDVDLAKTLNDPALIERVRTARAVYFSGGAQELIVDTLQPGGQPTEMLKAIWEVYRKGGVVAGTSAGAAIMSTVMFRDAQDSMQVLKGRLREGKEIDRGLGFVGPDLFIDQHFLKRGRFGRMLPLMQAKGYKLGLGVEENSAAIIKGDSVEVIGAKGALLVDLGAASHDAKLPAFNVRGAQLTYLDRGDKHDLKTGQTTPAPQKARDLRINRMRPTSSPTSRTSLSIRTCWATPPSSTRWASCWTARMPKSPGWPSPASRWRAMTSPIWASSSACTSCLPRWAGSPAVSAARTTPWSAWAWT